MKNLSEDELAKLAHELDDDDSAFRKEILTDDERCDQIGEREYYEERGE